MAVNCRPSWVSVAGTTGATAAASGKGHTNDGFGDIGGDHARRARRPAERADLLVEVEGARRPTVGIPGQGEVTGVVVSLIAMLGARLPTRSRLSIERRL
jgi:hypothetical protein